MLRSVPRSKRASRPGSRSSRDWSRQDGPGAAESRAPRPTAGVQVAARVRDEVSQLRGAVAEKQAALDAAVAALRTRQERVPSELGAYRGVPQVVAATAELLTDDAQKSSPQVFIDAVAQLLDTLERLRSSDIATISVTWEVNSVLTQLANPVTVQHILSSAEGGQATSGSGPCSSPRPSTSAGVCPASRPS